MENIPALALTQSLVLWVSRERERGQRAAAGVDLFVVITWRGKVTANTHAACTHFSYTHTHGMFIVCLDAVKVCRAQTYCGHRHNG